MDFYEGKKDGNNGKERVEKNVFLDEKLAGG